jgi:DNA-binding SARP family transcriptional activator
MSEATRVLHISLFGQLSVTRRVGESEWQPIEITGRPGSLLAYLALARGRFFQRGELLLTLWSDQSDALASAGALNTTLWRLRKALERPTGQAEIVVCDRRGAIGLAQDAPLELDIDAFTGLLAPALAKPLEQLDTADLVALRRGVELYRDDILTGFTDAWALRERELHRRMLLNALARLMQLSALAQDHAGAIRYALDILDRDPLREDVHRELMRLYLANGQRAMALRQFEACRAALRKELAIQPMRETMAVYQRIAESAVGHDDTADTSLTYDALLAPAARDDVALPGLAARRLVETARRHLALADAQLQQSLPLFDPPQLPH